MKRITVMIPTDIDDRLRREARRRGVPIADITREALDAYLPEPPAAVPGFFAIGASDSDEVSERVDEFLAAATGEEPEDGAPC